MHKVTPDTAVTCPTNISPDSTSIRPEMLSNLKYVLGLFFRRKIKRVDGKSQIYTRIHSHKLRMYVSVAFSSCTIPSTLCCCCLSRCECCVLPAFRCGNYWANKHWDLMLSVIPFMKWVQINWKWQPTWSWIYISGEEEFKRLKQKGED